MKDDVEAPTKAKLALLINILAGSVALGSKAQESIRRLVSGNSVEERSERPKKWWMSLQNNQTDCFTLWLRDEEPPKHMIETLVIGGLIEFAVGTKVFQVEKDVIIGLRGDILKIGPGDCVEVPLSRSFRDSDEELKLLRLLESVKLKLDMAKMCLDSLQGQGKTEGDNQAISNTLKDLKEVER